MAEVSAWPHLTRVFAKMPLHSMSALAHWCVKMFGYVPLLSLNRN